MLVPVYFYEKPDDVEPCNQQEQPDKRVIALNELLKRARQANIPYKSDDNEVFFDGDPNAEIMFVGEAPGQDEVIQKKPFVGRSGQLLQQMLNAAGITRDKMYITNVVLWRPPNNQTPLPEEIDAMRPYLLEHIQIIKPKILVCIGGIAYKCLSSNPIAISKIRGQWFETSSCSKSIVIFHPSYLLRSQIHKRETWEDILQIRKEAISGGINLNKGILL